MDILDGLLKAVETKEEGGVRLLGKKTGRHLVNSRYVPSGLWYLYFCSEAFCKIFINDEVRGRKEGEDTRDEEALVVVKLGPPVADVRA